MKPPRVQAFATVIAAAAGLGAPGAIVAVTHDHNTHDLGEQTTPTGESLVHVDTDREAGRIRLRVGPVSLDAGGHHLRLPIETVELPVNGWLHGFSWSLEDGQGHPLPNDLLHHFNLIDPDRRELFTPVARRVVAAGSETPPQEMPRMVGYPIEAGSRLMVLVMLGTSDTNYDEVYLNIELPYTDAELVSSRPGTVYPFWIDVTGPVGDKDFPVPTGRTVMSWEGSPAIDATIMALGGHMHDYATELRLEDVTEGTVLWRAEPEKTPDGRLISLPTDVLIASGGIELQTSHTYRISVAYDNPLDGPAPDGGMGSIGGIVLAAPDASFPALDPENEDYVTDLQNTLDSPKRAGHGGHGTSQAEHSSHDAPEAGHDSHGAPDSSEPLAGGPSAAGAMAMQTPERSSITVTDDPDSETLTITLGPVDLPAGADPNALKQLPVQEGLVPFDFYMHGYEVQAIDGAGNPVPQIVIHHANVLDPAHRELFLPIMRRIIAWGSETKPQQLPAALAGLPWREGDRFLALTMLHNPTEVSYEDVEIRIAVKYTKTRPANLVFPLHLDVMFPTGSKAFDLPVGRSVKSWEGSPAIEARLIGLGGHLHRYATRLWLEDVSTGEVLYEVSPVVAEDGSIEDVPVQLFMSARGIGKKVYSDRVYRISAEYDNPTGQVIEQDAMGAVAGAFVADAPLLNLVAPVGDALFIEDYAWVLESTTHGHGPAHQH